MNYKLLSAILKSNWAIDPIFAYNSMNWINDLFQGKIEVDTTQDQTLLPSITSKSARSSRVTSFNDAPEGSIAIIPIKGSLMKDDQLCGPMGMATIGEYIKEADRNDNIEGILLNVDSPGGTVDGTETLASIVKQTSKPVVTFVDGLMASAALWISSPSDEIIASTGNDEVGSVGVVTNFMDLQPFYEDLGVKFHRITADQSNEKVKMFEEIRSGNYTQYKNEFLNPIAETFMGAIRENRPSVEDKHLHGKVFLAQNAMGVFVDRIGTYEEALDRVHELAQQTKSSNNQKQGKAMQNYEHINAALGLQSLEADKDGYVSLTEEQLQTINEKLGSVSQVTQERDQANEQVTNLKTENQNLTNQVSDLQNQVTELKKEPGANHTDVSKETDSTSSKEEESEFLSDEDIKLFNNLKS